MLNYDIHTPLSDEDVEKKLDAIARQVVDRRMEMPMAMFLEMHKPLSFLASQAMIVGMPFLGPFVGHQKMADYSKLLSDSANVERLILRIEELAAQRDESDKADKAAKTEE